MKFSEEKKKAIMLYILEKIEWGEENITKSISETFSVNQNTIHTYVNQLVKDNIIVRVKKGHYSMVENFNSIKLYRNKGQLDNDTEAFHTFYKSYLKDLSTNVQTIWEYTITEMINNVIEHSEAEMANLAVLQNHLTTTVFIEDNGIGIFKKIKNHFGYDTLEDAICELFKGKLTTDEKKHSGEGIFFSSKAVDKFFIVSDGRFFTNNKYENEKILNTNNSDEKGTLVIMSLSNFSNRDMRDVFDQYSDVDGGFTKTVIPLKNIFDTAPVSRSQAKRVCNRLSGFEEVILDFEGLDWMGQGFAHQIFVVFKNENPNVNITAVNMTAGVEKMYNHVLN